MRTYTTYDAATLDDAGVLQRLGDEHAWSTPRRGRSCSSRPAAIAACPQASPPTPTSCVFRIDAAGRGQRRRSASAPAVTLLGPGPAVVVSDTTTGQFDLMRLS